jgi:hypothetical protein
MTDRFSETMDVIESYIRAVGGEKQDGVLAKCSEARKLFAIQAGKLQTLSRSQSQQPRGGQGWMG